MACWLLNSLTRSTLLLQLFKLPFGGVRHVTDGKNVTPHIQTFGRPNESRCDGAGSTNDDVSNGFALCKLKLPIRPGWLGTPGQLAKNV